MPAELRAFRAEDWPGDPMSAFVRFVYARVAWRQANGVRWRPRRVADR